MKRIKHSSVSDYITTLCFIGLTILSYVKANEAISEDNTTKSFILFLLSAIFFTSSLRFSIARVFYGTHKLFIERQNEKRTPKK